MTEYITEWYWDETRNAPNQAQREEIVRCRDCKHFDIPDWDNTLAENYGEPPMFCMQLSMNEWRMDGDRRVADTTFLEVEPDCFCKWGERREP